MKPYICITMGMDKDTPEEFYKRLKAELLNTQEWPANYLYKFIVPTDADKIQRIHRIFDNTGAVVESRQSRKGKYTSISITVQMEDPDAVIRKYKEVGTVEGVISL